MEKKCVRTTKRKSKNILILLPVFQPDKGRSAGVSPKRDSGQQSKGHSREKSLLQRKVWVYGAADGAGKRIPVSSYPYVLHTLFFYYFMDVSTASVAAFSSSTGSISRPCRSASSRSSSTLDIGSSRCSIMNSASSASSQSGAC